MKCARRGCLYLAFVALVALSSSLQARVVLVPRIIFFDGVPTVRLVPRFVPDEPPQNTPSEADAARFLTQATFGPTTESIASVRSLGYSAWLDRQFDLLDPPQVDY